ncbi:DUF475 domain-containing protein [Methylococcus sp. EFPC2]|uniref:DUF475 domain-containing protein n=1 Tax=Methylococcus sp. EFPC2 TaxID=2812648 RepID=UPI00196761A5|nr:DUF475 domain-containing protein [Methylococcus sp. EFPC2]QSA97961.1 DUF475 domain-containing protein [Methylococcus sp. EFPC2]
MRNFISALLVAAVCLAAAYYWSGSTGLLMATILGIMEVSLSFDNAVVNATVLKKMSPRWQQRFLTWGMVIAVFGVRFLFPVLIVALITGHSLQDVTLMALHQPEEYARHIDSAHTQISAFGGMYLLLVFLSFFVQEHKSLHWLVWLEKRLSSMGKLESIEVVLALSALLATLGFLPEAERLPMLIAGIAGVILFVLVKSVATLFEGSEGGPQLQRAGLVSFLYLELLDLSFSFDGVIGAFAITRDVVIILLGLTIGAMFVRSLTVFMVRKGTLDEYLYLEHGAHYAIGALAVLMLVDISVHVPEIATGLTGLGLILLSLWSSVRARARQAAGGAD